MKVACMDSSDQQLILMYTKGRGLELFIIQYRFKVFFLLTNTFFTNTSKFFEIVRTIV